MRPCSDGLPVPQRYGAIFAIALGITVSVLDGAIANVALPTIARDLNASPASSIWVVNAYQLAITVSLLSLASLGDLIGYRRIYQAGLLVFSITSLFCALSDSLLTLTIARVLQGFGAAAIMSVNTALIRIIYPQRFLGRGMGINSLIVACSSAAGPTVAAAILSVASWQWLFAINLPIGLVALLLGMKFLPANGQKRQPPFRSHQRRAERVDVRPADHRHQRLRPGPKPDADLQRDRRAAGDWRGVRAPPAAPGISAAAGRPTAHPDLRPVDGHLNLLVCCANAGDGVVAVLPAKRIGPRRSGDRAAADAVAAGDRSHGADRRPAGGARARRPAGLHWAGGVRAWLFSLALLPADPSNGDIIWRMVLCGAGFGLFQSPNNHTIISAAPRNRSGGASGMLGTARLLGQTSGPRW